jgi:hypothetical protein
VTSNVNTTVRVTDRASSIDTAYKMPLQLCSP